MSDTVFSPGIWTRDILAPMTRDAVSTWLRSQPETHDGYPVIAVRQSFYCEPAEDFDPLLDPNHLASFESMGVRVNDIAPSVRHKTGVGNMWSGEVRQEAINAYHRTFFHLSHDETYIRLINSDLRVVVEPSGSQVHFFHFEHGSLMISEARATQISAEDWDKGSWGQALVTAILPQTSSAHAKISQMREIEVMNRHLGALYTSVSDNFQDAQPLPIDVARQMSA